MIWLFFSFLAGTILLLVTVRKKASPGKAAGFSLPKISLAGHGLLIAKWLWTAAIVLLVYFLPSLFKDSMPGKALLSGLSTIGIAEWYEWTIWVPAGVMAWLVIRRSVWKQSASDGGKATPFPWGTLIVTGCLAVAGVVAWQMWLKRSHDDAVSYGIVAGQSVSKWVTPHSEMVVTVMRHPQSNDGIIHLACGQIIEPAALVDAPAFQGEYIKKVPSAPAYMNSYEFTEEARQALGNTRVKVEFTAIAVHYHKRHGVCPHTAY